jgi:hypothetical protein
VSRGTQEPLERGLQFRIRGSHPLWPAFPDRSPIAFLPSLNQERTSDLKPNAPPDYCGPSTPSSPCESLGLACSAFARHYLRNRGCFLFLEVLRWFTSLGSPLPAYVFSRRSLDMTPVGLPHSEIPGSKRACRSPRLIAACCVLHRLSVPRHPPSTLSNLTIKCLDLMRSAV